MMIANYFQSLYYFRFDHIELFGAVVNVVCLKDSVDFIAFLFDYELACDFTCALPDPIIRKFDLQRRQRAPNSFLSSAETQSNSRSQAVLYLVFLIKRTKTTNHK
jgi:hypothetical protein